MTISCLWVPRKNTASAVPSQTDYHVPPCTRVDETRSQPRCFSKPLEFLLHKFAQFRAEHLCLKRALECVLCFGVALHRLQGNAVAHQPDTIIRSELQYGSIMLDRIIVAILALEQRREESLVIGLLAGKGQ